MSPELPVVQCEAMTFARRHDGVFSTALLMIAMAVSSLLRLGAAGSQGVPKLVPVDEAPRRPDFLAFRQQLQEIVDRRDLLALLQVVDPKIKYSFGGGDDGIDGLKKYWESDDHQARLWDELRWILAHGGTFEGPDTFVAPYVSSRWPDAVDGFEHVALVGSHVRIRAAAGEQAPVLETLSYAILRLRGNSYPQRPWTAVELPDGRAAFVASDLVRSPIEYRAEFRRIDGRWRMTIFIEGD